MSVVITVMNMKGGVGKTTVTMNLGGVLGMDLISGRRRRVLLIDYDPQFNLSQAFLPAKTYFDEHEAKRRNCLAILQDDETKLDPFEIQVPGNHHPPGVEGLVFEYHAKDGSQLHILPSTMDLMYVALGQTAKRTDPIEERFSRFIEECRRRYDVILIDCHPAGSILTKTSLKNSDHVLIPVEPQPYAVRGVGLMRTFIERFGNKAPRPHVLFNKVPRSGTLAEETEIRREPRYASYCLTRTMKKYAVLARPKDGQGFIWQGQTGRPTRFRNEALRNVRSIAEELLDRMGGSP